MRHRRAVLAVVVALALGGCAPATGGPAAAPATTVAIASIAPSSPPVAAASAAASPSASAGHGIFLVAKNERWNTRSLTVPANQPFEITLVNEDPDAQHDISIKKDPKGEVTWQGDFTQGVGNLVQHFPALPPGTYTFLCSVHPETMTGTLIVH